MYKNKVNILQDFKIIFYLVLLEYSCLISVCKELS